MSKGKNIAAQYRDKVNELHERIAQEIVTASKQLGEKFRAEVVKRTPADQGDLKLKWALMPVQKVENRYIITLTNPAEYAAYVEFGYMQRPGMILRMKVDGSKLRFKKFLGYSRKYRLGDPTDKAMPDEKGEVVIVTRKRFIKGRFMARDGLEETKKTHWPKLKKYLLATMKRIWEKGK